jgi:hypothetical protein
MIKMKEEKLLRTKKRIVSLLVAFSFVLAQAVGLFGSVASAEGRTHVEVYVEGNTGLIAQGGFSNSLSALEVLNNTLLSNFKSPALIDSDGMISSIDGLSNTADWSKYWMIAINRNGTYVDITEGINSLMLQNGDRLIVYYSAPDTYTANKIEYSTKLPYKKLTISLNSEQKNWNTGKMEVIPLSSPTMKAWIDGNPVNIDQNKIVLESGLGEGTHTLKVSDYQADASLMPRVVEDKFSFDICIPTCSVRVEGLNGTMVEGSAQGETALEIVKKVLAAKNVSLNTASYYGEYITEIGALKENDISAGTGWMYYVKSKTAITSPLVGIDSYVPGNGDEIVLYFSGWEMPVPYVNSITFNPGIVPVNNSFTMKFSYSYTDWSDWTNPVAAIKGIAGALVTIDGTTNYVTDTRGEITIDGGLVAGTHTYRISGYNSGALSTVVMDEGTFNIDGVHSPSFDLSKSTYDSSIGMNNLLVNKDITGSISAAAGFVKGYNDPWANVSMQKLGMSDNNSYILEDYQDISKNGVSGYSNTELEKLIFGLTANGFSPYSFAGSNLVSELYSRSADSFQVSDTIYALLAMEYANIPNDYSVTSQVLVDRLLSLKVTDGTSTGWSLSGYMDPDITGAAICALSSYMDNNEVAAAVNKAILSLEDKVTNDGYVPGQYGTSSETNAFVIMGLLSVGVNPEGVTTLSDGSVVNFAKMSGDLVSAMLSFKTSDGMFKHTLDGNGNNMATEECLRALIALNGFKASGEAYDYYSSDINATVLKVFTPFSETTQQSTTASASGTSSSRKTSDSGTASSDTAGTMDINDASAADVASNNETTSSGGENSSDQTSTESQDADNSATDKYIKVGGGLVAMGVLGTAVYLMISRKENFR